MFIYQYFYLSIYLFIYLYKIKKYIEQEPPYLSDASNLCTAVGGDQNKNKTGATHHF